jgi:hypothetical protein
MKSNFKKKLCRFSGKACIIHGIFLVVIFELITCIFRFGFHLESTRDTAFLSKFTFGFRIHHGYIGIVLLIAGLIIKHKSLRNALIILGIGLFVSDMLHHFAVLWPITGSPHFDIKY